MTKDEVLRAISETTIGNLPTVKVWFGDGDTRPENSLPNWYDRCLAKEGQAFHDRLVMELIRARLE